MSDKNSTIMPNSVKTGEVLLEVKNLKKHFTVGTNFFGASRRLENCQGLNYINSSESALSTVLRQYHTHKTNVAAHASSWCKNQEPDKGLASWLGL